MTRWEHVWAVEVLAAFAPSSTSAEADARLAPRDGEVDYLHVYRRMKSGSTPLAALGLRLAVWMAALAPFWLLGRFETISTLARTERSELLARLLRHTSFAVRELALLLKLTAAIALLGTPSVRERSGYDKPQVAAAVAREVSRRQLPVVPIATKLTPQVVHAPASSVHPSEERVAS